MSSSISSAVDDRFKGVQWPSASRSSIGSDREYSGRREGNWEVNSSVGSFIDDRCPTITGYARIGAGFGNVQSLKPALTKKLQQTQHAKKLQAASDGDAALTKTRTAHTQPSDKVTKPRIFKVPPFKNEKKRNGQLKPMSPAAPIKKVEAPQQQKRQKKQTPAEKKVNKTQTLSKPEQSIRASVVKEAIVASSRTTGIRSVRILGKNGEEAFVHLPQVPTCLTSMSVNSKASSTPNGERRSTKSSKKKQEIELGADIGSLDSVNEHNFAKFLEQKLTVDEHQGNSVVHEPLHQFFEENSSRLHTYRPPVVESVASSARSERTSARQCVSEHLMVPESYRSVRQEATSFKHDSHHDTSTKKSSRTHNTASTLDMDTGYHFTHRTASMAHLQPDDDDNEVILIAPRSVQHSIQRSARQLPSEERLETVRDTAPLQHSVSQSYQHSPRTSQTSRKPTSSHQSTHSHQSAHSHQYSPQRSLDEQEPTIYAGTGWISPHPLSTVASAESVINLPFATESHGEYLTHEQWQHIRQEQDVRAATSIHDSDRVLDAQSFLSGSPTPRNSASRDDSSTAGSSYLSGTPGQWYSEHTPVHRAEYHSGTMLRGTTRASLDASGAPSFAQLRGEHAHGSRASSSTRFHEDWTASHGQAAAFAPASRIATISSASSRGSRSQHGSERQVVHLLMPWDVPPY